MALGVLTVKSEAKPMLPALMTLLLPLAVMVVPRAGNKECAVGREGVAGHRAVIEGNARGHGLGNRRFP